MTRVEPCDNYIHGMEPFDPADERGAILQIVEDYNSRNPGREVVLSGPPLRDSIAATAILCEIEECILRQFECSEEYARWISNLILTRISEYKDVCKLLSRGEFEIIHDLSGVFADMQMEIGNLNCDVTKLTDEVVSLRQEVAMIESKHQQDVADLEKRLTSHLYAVTKSKFKELR